MPLYIAQSGDLDRCYRCLTDWLTDSQTKDRATQLLIMYKSGALVTQWQRQQRRQRQRQSAYKNQHMFYSWNPVLIPNVMIDTSITSPWSSCSHQSPWLPCCYGHTISSTGPSVSTFWDFFPHKSRYDDTISCALCTLPVKRNRIFRQAQLFYNGSTKNILHDI